MASISLPPQSTSTFSHYLDSSTPSPRGHSRRNLSMSNPLPNPHFVFPARDPDAPAEPSEPKVSRARAPAPLPAFSFNPGASHSAQPSMPTLPVNRPGGHRRRCSEFIGTERLVSPENLEITRNNDESPAPAPASLPTPGPGFSAGGPGRRRHAHRRSAAISSVDLTAISNALDVNALTASSPGTPADATSGIKQHLNEAGRPLSHSATSLHRPTPPASPSITINGESLYEATPDSPVGSVAFQSGIAEVPSKDSESTTTIRPGSTARNSEQSGPPPDKGPNTANGSPKPRPRTADASLMLNMSGDDGADDMSRVKRPLSATGHSRFRKSLSSGVLDAALRRHNSGDDPSWVDFRHSSDGDSDTSGEDRLESSESGPRKRSKAKKRQKKVRSWAGSILTRGKGRRQPPKMNSSEEESEATPPVITRTNSDMGSGLDVDFDDDNIVVIRTPTATTVPKSYQTIDDEPLPTLESSWKPRSFYEQGTQNDALSPIIDLDAALGPFNTPDIGSRNLPESGFSAASRRMYSGGRRGEFIGPEMRYHRRAESAPALPPFDRSFLASSRLSTNLTLENPDVFYEEEEDAFLAATSESARESDGQTSAPAIASSTDDSDEQSVHSKESSDTLTHQPIGETNEDHAGLGIGREEDQPQLPTLNDSDSRPDTTPPAEQQSSAGQPRDSGNPFSSQTRSPVEAAKQENWYRKIPIPPSPDVSPRFLPADHRPATSPLELTPNIPQFSLQGGSSLSNSSFPSPDFTISSDAPRSITTSSTADRNFSNLSYNPSMDFPHSSVDDVPSLTSSASTMTNTLNRVSANFFQRPRISTDRSASFSAAIHRRSSQPRPSSSKRSSLASLSKLVGGPSGERSKLSHEEKPPGDEPERGKRKGRRISRLMHFWRAKDKDRLNEDVQEERPS